MLGTRTTSIVKDNLNFSEYVHANTGTSTPSIAKVNLNVSKFVQANTMLVGYKYAIDGEI